MDDRLLNGSLASDYPREYDGACLQMRLSYSPAAHLFLFLVQWTGFHLAGALGLLRILIYKAYEDGKTTMSIHERKASIRERARSQSCPFCRDSLKRVNSGDLWIYTSRNEIIDLSSITRQNLKRLFMYIDRLPLIVPDPVLVPYEPCYRKFVLTTGTWDCLCPLIIARSSLKGDPEF
ncbi:E3 ubiquitin-protein ligase AIRP2 isoform X1 [Populus alba x Populus x berolinensis]|uniref:E3 ubiquitin-protein ligase AIRP2 isoform X1 n=1 Tax=Populus alba x Populus x berolinensis TaxID=444605 RepID=A0AAD6VZE2_9ROSI|nr:E3 ubiquitin-protein ligase AIRP2 isoform X1 [Populus alba x Populus x berolinensis]